jgi:DNA-binding PadR family transcriptional regulator
MVDRLILEELRRAPAHGYAISTALARRRLEGDGVVTGKWQDGRRRRVYRLTRAGDVALRLRRLEVRSLSRR